MWVGSSHKQSGWVPERQAFRGRLRGRCKRLMLRQHNALQELSASARRAERKAAAAAAAAALEEEKRNSDMWASVRKLVASPSFQVPSLEPASHCILLYKPPMCSQDGVGLMPPPVFITLICSVLSCIQACVICLCWAVQQMASSSFWVCTGVCTGTSCS